MRETVVQSQLEAAGAHLVVVAVDFIIVVGDAYRPIAGTELEHERPEIVAEARIIDPGIAQSVANGDVDGERRWVSASLCA